MPALLVVDGIRGLYLGKLEMPAAYCLLRDRADSSTSALDLAACDSAAAFNLCAGLNGISGLLRVINEPEESLFLPALKAHGFVETDQQHEMLMEL